MRRIRLLLVVTSLIVGLAITPAHAGGSGHSHHEPSTGPVAILLLGAIALGLATAGRSRRPVASVVLGLLVALFSAGRDADPSRGSVTTTRT
jgi:peptidoglycan/LPS O-acetylase OafA/YrhL